MLRRLDVLAIRATNLSKPINRGDLIARIMKKFIKRLLRSKSKEPRERASQPHQLTLPIMPPLTYAIGDVHGCLDLYQDLEERIANEAKESGPVLIILLGDLVDRGADSAGVISHIMGPAPSGIQRLTLMGNHEQMMLQFLDAPRANIRWLDYGGQATLASYGVTEADLGGFDMPEPQLAQKMKSLIPQEHIAWMRRLPAAVRLGSRYFLSHSGLNPSKPLGAQSARDLMWSRGIKAAPPNGLTVVHGHTPIEAVDLTGPYINIDTGAYETGRLSAVRLSAETSPQLLEVARP